MTRAPVWLHRFSFAVAMLGLATSAFLAWEYSRGGTITCPIAGTGCDQVRASQFSAIFGVPVPWLGLGFYGSFAALEIIRLEATANRLLVNRLIVAMAAIGAFASGWFTYLEAFVIGAWCFWCLVSAACAVTLLVLGGADPERRASVGVVRET